MTKQLKVRQICLFFIAFLPITKFFMMPSIIAEWSHEDIWISTFIGVAVDFFTVLILSLICRNENANFFQMTETAFGKSGKNIIFFLYALFFIMKAVLPVNEQKDYVELTLYVTMPSVAIFLPFFAVAFYICFYKLRVLGRISDIVWAFSATGIFLIFFLSLKTFDPETFLPVGANGIKNILRGSYSATNWFGDGLYFAFFMGEYLHEKKETLKICLSFLLASLSVVIFTVFFYTAFDSIAYRQRFALTEMSKYTTVINNVGRFDYIAIFFILFSSVFALILPVFFANMCLREVFPVKIKWIFQAVICLILITVIVFFNKYFAFIEWFMTRVAGGIFIFFQNLLPVLIAIIYKLKNQKGERAFETYKK